MNLRFREETSLHFYLKDSFKTTSVIVYASAFYCKVEITLLNYMTFKNLFPPRSPDLPFRQSLTFASLC